MVVGCCTAICQKKRTCVLQLSDDVSVGHAVPPQLTLVVIGRERCRVPPSQGLLHEPHEPHEPTWHDTGQHVCFKKAL